MELEKFKLNFQKETSYYQDLSRRRIGRITKDNGLVSSYSIAQFKPQKTPTNEVKIRNQLNREFNQTDPL